MHRLADPRRRRAAQGAAGDGYWGALEELGALGAIPVQERVVFDKKYVSGAGVSAGIDMALTLAGRLRGDDVAQAVQLIIEYAPQPPYSAGSPDSAGPDIVASAQRLLSAQEPT